MKVSSLSPDQRAELFSSPFVSSWAARSRPGERATSDVRVSAGAWASWALLSFVEVSSERRSYFALNLEGRLYRSGRLHDAAHLEVPAWRWGVTEPLFPDRLAYAGAAMRFPSLVFDEVAAMRRGVFASGTSDTLVSTLSARADRMREALAVLTGRMAPHVPALPLTTAPESLSNVICEPFSSGELSAVLPEAAGWQLTLDTKLVASSGRFLSRRMHVWRLVDDAGSLLAVTPRLTVGSLLIDNLFSPSSESPAAAFTRLALLSRLAEIIDVDPSGVMPPPPPADGFLRTVPVRDGGKTPSASVESAVAFALRFPNASEAYRRLEELASGRFTLVVSKASFCASHERILGCVQRAEDPERGDVDTVLPLVVGSDGAVSRVSFARRS